MKLFDALRQDIEFFKIQREHMMKSAFLPRDMADAVGKPPFVVEFGSTPYCLLHSDGKTVPLPYGYRLPDDKISLRDNDGIFSWLAPQAGGGANLARLIPVVANIENPDKSSFAIEDLPETELWDAADKYLRALQEKISDRVRPVFAKLFYVVAIQGQAIDEVESIEQAMASMLSEESIVQTLFVISLEETVAEFKEGLEVDDSDDEE